MRYTHLVMDGIGAQRSMLGVRFNEVFNMSTGTATVSVPNDDGVVIRGNVSIDHLRPYVE